MVTHNAAPAKTVPPEMPILFFDRERARRERTQAERPRDWTTQEVAELYRVRDRLADAGLAIALATGASDEGDPWAVFETIDTGEVVVHVARIDGQLVVVNPATSACYRGLDFRAVTDRMLAGADAAVQPKKASNVVPHPRSVLTAFVAAAVVLAEMTRGIEDARAAEGERAPSAGSTRPGEDGLLALLSRLLARDSSGAAAVAGAGAWGVVAAAAIATDLELRAERGPSEAALGLAEHAIAKVAAMPGQDAWSAPLSRGEASEAIETVSGDVAPPPGMVVAVHQGRPSDSRLEEVRFETPVQANSREALATHEKAEITTAIDGQAAPVALPALLPITTSPPLRLSEGTGDVVRAEVRVETAAPRVAALVDKIESSVLVMSLSALAARSEPGLVLATAAGDLHLRVSGDRLVFDDAASADTTSDLEPDAAEPTAEPRGEAEAGSLVPAPTSDLPTVEPPAPRPDPTPATPAPQPARMSFHENAQAPAHFTDGVIDVFFFRGGVAHIHNFRFGEDILLVNGSHGLSNWMRDVTIEGADIKIVGTDGSTIWLVDSLHTFA